MMKKTVGIMVWTAVFAAGAALLMLSGEFSPCFSEGFRTFFYEGTYLHDSFFRIGGGAGLLADFMMQFCIGPVAGCMVCSFVLTLIAGEFARLLSRISGGDWLLPAALFPAVILGVLGHNVNYLFSGSAAMLLMLFCVNIQYGIKGDGSRLLFSVISAVALFFMAGAIAALYAVLLLMIEFFNRPGRSWRYLIPAAAVYLSALLSLRTGWSGEIRHLLTPGGYFTLRLRGGSFNWLPWTLTVASVFTAELWSGFRLRTSWLTVTVTALLTAVLVWFCVWRAPEFIDSENEVFKELSYRVGSEDWDGVTGRCSTVPMDNLVRQNCLNVALAEKGILADRLFTNPCYDIRSIYVSGSKNPYIYTLLSDVYWSMGHIAFSQRYAFEANESLGNYSPRLLKRLVQTNESLDYPEVAAKYRRLLSKTLFYRDWAENYVTPQVMKNCVFPDDRLCGIKGLDDDLTQIVLNCPGHTQTIQYLGSLCLLLRDTERFMNVMDTFYGTDALPEVLPTAFQEGIVHSAGTDEVLLEKYHIQKEVLDRYESYRKDHRSQPKSFWFFMNDMR